MEGPAYPGMLLADILKKGSLTTGGSVTGLAKHLGVTRAAMSRVIHGQAAVSAEMALKLEDALGVKAEVWLGMQAKRDLWRAARKGRRVVESLVRVDAPLAGLKD